MTFTKLGGLSTARKCPEVRKAGERHSIAPQQITAPPARKAVSANQTTVINPVGGKTTYTYDRKNGKVSSITDAAGNRRIFKYNKIGELTEETDIRGNTTSYEYNALGKITSITDGAGRTTRHYYFPGGRREKTVYPNGRQMSYEYDTLGRLKKKTDQNGYGISYIYDCMGRILSVTSSTGQKKDYAYDAMGNVTSVTDANGNTTKYAYTLNGRLKEVTDALGNKTEYAYDKADRLIYICQHGQSGEIDRTQEYERDALGQIACIRDALGGEEYFRYDALGRMIEKTDRDGMVTAYSYTADGRPESILYGDGSRADMEYTPLRQLEVVRDWLGETRIERDRQGSPISITDHNGRTVRYEWGSMGQRQGMTYPDGTKVSWTYDSLLRLAEMRRTAEGKDALWVRYHYDTQGRLAEKINSGGYCTRWNYNETGFLDELTHEDASGILDRFRYAYDDMGNKTTVWKDRRGLPEESGAYRYSYDGLQRLVGIEKDGELLRRYEYDTFGNRVGMEDYVRGKKSLSKYDALDRLLEQEIWEDISDNGSAVHKTYMYDRRGNLIGEYQDGELLHGYAFNSMNRLEKAWNGQGEKAEYFYNALGQRTGRSARGETEEYLLDLTKQYHNLLGFQKGKQQQSFYWDFNVVAMDDENKTARYYLQDELGSPLRVLYRNGNGDMYGYDEFGRDLHDPEKEQRTGKQYSRQLENQPFGYTGYRHDDISGTYFAQAREYQPQTGRFTAEDIVKGNGADPKVFNRYGYCWDNPVLLVDLNGLDPAWLDGIYAHLQFEWQFLALCYDDKKDGDINVYIPGGGKKGGKGYADVVLYNTNDAQIYEIKPQSYYDDSTKKQDGESQLDRYVNAYNNNGNNPNAIKGQMSNVEPLLFIEEVFLFDTERTIIYRMYEDSPGMIYYELRYKDAERQKAYEENKFQVPLELDEAIEKMLILTLIASATTAEKMAEVGAMMANGLFFLLIPQYELDSIQQRYMGGCYAEA